MRPSFFLGIIQPQLPSNAYKDKPIKEQVYMAIFNAKCPLCGSDYQAQEEWIGGIGECPECHKDIKIEKPNIEPSHKSLKIPVNTFVKHSKTMPGIKFPKEDNPLIRSPLPMLPTKEHCIENQQGNSSTGSLNSTTNIRGFAIMILIVSAQIIIQYVSIMKSKKGFTDGDIDFAFILIGIAVLLSFLSLLSNATLEIAKIIWMTLLWIAVGIAYHSFAIIFLGMILNAVFSTEVHYVIVVLVETVFTILLILKYLGKKE